MLRRTFLLLLVTLALPYGARAGEAPVILVLGDSISAGYGLETGEGWVTLLQQRLAEHGSPYQVVNASISGDTTAGGMFRLDPLLDKHRPVIMILELGGNDGLRGQPVDRMRANLRTMIERARQNGAHVLLLGMRLPPNYGAEYTEAFHAAYGEVAAETGVPLVPFLLAGMEDQLQYMQADGIHPGAEMQPGILDNVWPVLKPMLATGG